MIKKRFSQIMSTIIQRGDWVTIESLSELLGVSPRTIRYDLDGIDYLLESSSIPKLQRMAGKGVAYDGDEEKLKSISILFNTGNSYDYILTSEERVRFIINELLMKKGYSNIQFISQELSVSKGTVLKELKLCHSWLRQHNIRLRSVRGKGIKIEGEERNIREAYFQLFEEFITTTDIIDMLHKRLKGNEAAKIKFLLNRVFENIDLSLIESCIITIEKQLEAVFTDEAFNNLIIQLAILLIRLRLHKEVAIEKESLDKLKKTKEFTAASSIAVILEEDFGVYVSLEEIAYITILILSSNLKDSEDLDRNNWVEIRLLTQELIEKMEFIAGYKFTLDTQLFLGLIQHIRPALYRLIHNIKIKNPLIDGIKASYGAMFDAVRKSSLFINDKYKNAFSDEEIGYLVLHFQASIEKSKIEKVNVPRVMVVCGTGIGTSKLVAAKLIRIFHVDIVAVTSYREVQEVLSEKSVDIVVTTVPLAVDNIECIKVSPFITEEDILSLNEAFGRMTFDNRIGIGNEEKLYKNKSVYREGQEVSELIDIIESFCDIRDLGKLKESLHEYLQHKNNGKQLSKKEVGLIEVLSTEAIEVAVRAESWQEAINNSGSLLLRQGCITKGYIDAMIDSVRELGPYIVIERGIAMPHARPEKGAKKIGLGIAVLEKPIFFSDEQEAPVSIIIALSAVDNITHMRVLKELMEVIETDDFLDKAVKAKNKAELLEIIISCMKK